MLHDPEADFIALQAALAGEYSLDRELGRGGMGVVYLAREVRLARPVAIKVLPPEFGRLPGLRDAFLSEARTAAGLSHPNIVPVYATGDRGGYAYIVMAFVEGTTLGERIRARGPLLPGQAARVLREVAWALAYAHGAGIVHRDVSAENIMLERGGERAIVMDFGIASAMQTNTRSSDGRVMGNAHYVSPEQAAGEPLDARSDLYSLGIVGFYALTGRLPFDGESSADVVAQQLTALAPTITSVAPSVPPRLANAVQRCLHKDPARRYRNAESFAEAIDLAFEHAKEIPAALRVWLSQGERELPARIAVFGVGSMAGVTLVYATTVGWTFLVPFVPLAAVSFIPGLVRLRRVLGDGYVVDDLHAAMREHQLARSEEIEYERRQRSTWFRRAMRVMFGSSLGSTALGLWFGWQQESLYALRGVDAQVLWGGETVVYSVLLASLSALTFSGVALGGEFVRLRLASRLASLSIEFWKGRWGTRVAKLASIGLATADRPALGMPLLTEVALGRATDHLFAALPKASRHELATLPDTVRRLERDAGSLRQSIDALDGQLAMFERGDALQDTERDRVADELRVSRALAADRLAATVTALENIRLDLLRLQMGSAGIESVTASLGAARAIGEQIAHSLGAQAEVERLLHPSTVRPAHDGATSARASDDHGDDEADTPVSGVPATRG
ncbi:MAG TPA: serine/threonine-protein kinase [Gemmatimonadaceae bacterium]|nr:serine/threonine-protein kinase [Gemmatimonadaceae bacterium]